MSALVQRIGAQAAANVEAFRNTAREFSAQYAWLQANRPPLVASPEIWAEYERLLSRSRVVGATLDTVTRAIDTVIGNTWRATGVDLAGIGLGALPVLPIALVAGGTATLVAGINAIKSYRERVRIFNELTRDGIAPSQAWREAAAVTVKPHVAETVTGNLAFAAIGVAVIVMLLRRK